jgi:uncharacterized repeat protein (TIGR01451 family)
MIINYIKKLFFIAFSILISNAAFAETPITLFQSYAGNVNFVGTGNTFRTQSNSGDPCLVNLVTNSASITGIPAGASITAAHLYWAGSYSTQTGSTSIAPDYTVTFEGSTVTAPASRRYTSNYTFTPGTTTYSMDFFSGVADVTASVSSKKNGSYSFGGLSVNSGATTDHCTTASVLAGWSLFVVYQAASEDLRVINLYEGFDDFRGSNIVLNPSNFRVPVSPINGRYGQITWEGDPTTFSTLNGFDEQLAFNGSTLSDGSNPAANQFNSISTIMSSLPSTGSTNTASYGLDFDVYTIDSLLSAGNTSATATYSSGGDLVMLSMQVISITNTPVSDLGISKTASSSFTVGSNATYDIVVNNAGPNSEPGNIVVTDTLPTGLTYVSAVGTGWGCSNTGQNITCTRTGSLAVSASTSIIQITVTVDSAASPSVSNTANVSGSNFDNITGNDNSTAVTSVSTGPNISLQKTSQTLSDPVNGTINPKAIPGALAEYAITATNSGLSAADNNSIVITDAIPANTALYVNDISGAGTGPVIFIDGTPSSGLTFSFISLSSTTDGLSFSNTSGADYSYTPSADADGVDTSVTNIRMATQGTFLDDSGSGSPNFQFIFRVKVK